MQRWCCQIMPLSRWQTSMAYSPFSLVQIRLYQTTPLMQPCLKKDLFKIANWQISTPCMYKMDDVQRSTSIQFSKLEREEYNRGYGEDLKRSIFVSDPLVRCYVPYYETDTYHFPEFQDKDVREHRHRRLWHIDITSNWSRSMSSSTAPLYFYRIYRRQ